MSGTLTVKECIDIIERTVTELKAMGPELLMPPTAVIFSISMNLAAAVSEKDRIQSKAPPPGTMTVRDPMIG